MPYPTNDNSNLPFQYRLDVATELAATTQSDYLINWENWKRLFYHWKYNRDFAINVPNESIEFSDPELYFAEPPADVIEN